MSEVSVALRSLGLSVEQISKRTKLHPDRVGALLNGASPTVAELRALRVGLRLPTRFFTKDSASARKQSLQFQFRSTAGSDDSFNPTIERVAAFVDAALDILPPRDALPSIVRSISPDSAASFAAALRETLGVDANSPLLGLPNIVGCFDGVILSILRESRFEGVSVLQENYLFIFVSPRFPARMLFSLAHELGHALSGDLTEHQSLFEGASSIGNYKKSRRKERFADDLAGHLLLPEEGLLQFIAVTRQQLNMPVSEPLGDIEILLLARFYGVSFEVAARRCEDSLILPIGGGFAIADHLRKHHKSPERRADELGLPVRQNIDFPSISPTLADALYRAIEDGEISSGRASERFGVPISEIFHSRVARPVPR